MPKRSTQTYSSEDAPQTDEDVITVYYCKYSGDPVLITDAVLGNLPTVSYTHLRAHET